MLAYIVRRLLLIIPTLLGIILLNFAIVQFAPGGPVEQMIAQIQGTAVDATSRVSGGLGDGGGAGTDQLRGDTTSSFESKYRGARGLPPEFIEELEKLVGFDKPPHERFFLMVKNYLQFDFGNSFFQDRTVYASQPTTRSYCNAILPAPSPSRGLASQGHRPDGWPVPLGHNYYGWFVESATIADLFAHVESASRDSLYAAASAAFVRQRCFEYATYQQVYVRVRVEPNPNPNPNPDPTPNLNPNPR